MSIHCVKCLEKEVKDTVVFLSPVFVQHSSEDSEL
jgi:hypothetical protein